MLTIGGGAASAGGGGVGSPEPPSLSDVVCAEGCAGLRAATASSRVRLSGKNLGATKRVRFAAAGGGRIGVKPLARSAGSVEAKVPDGAASGRVKVKDAYGSAAVTPTKLKVVPPDQVQSSGPFSLRAAEAKPRKTYFDGLHPPRVSYLFGGSEPTDVRIEVVRKGTGEVVQTMVDPAAEPNTQRVVEWDGRTVDGRLAPNGRYTFRVGSANGGKAETTADARFGFYSHRFPVPGRHSYGDGFGAGRGHQGQDVFARCGKRVLAARGGRVQWNKFHGRAGHYLVIDGKRTGTDYMYAHLAKRSPLRKGARVRTGQVIGRVGDTGNASGCHLHFEVWSKPGWYEGGSPLRSVRRLLKSWDSWS